MNSHKEPTMPITPDDLARLRTLCNLASAGPWEWRQRPKDQPDQMSVSDLIGPKVLCRWWGDNPVPVDGELIAAARNALPSLLDEIERLKFDIAQWMAGANAQANLNEQLRAELDRVRTEYETGMK